MILIGERINGMFKDVKEAIAAKDKKVIQNLAQSQTEAGANTSTLMSEPRPPTRKELCNGLSRRYRKPVQRL